MMMDNGQTATKRLDKMKAGSRRSRLDRATRLEADGRNDGQFGP